MLVETISGKCPCCGYDKLLQRFGSHGYYHLDGCANCGFGYGSTVHYVEGEEVPEVIGPEAWLSYGAYILASAESDKYYDEFEDDPQIVRQDNSVTYNGGETKESKACAKSLKVVNSLPIIELRKRLFDWLEAHERFDDIGTTVFDYTTEDVEGYRSTNPEIFKTVLR